MSGLIASQAKAIFRLVSIFIQSFHERRGYPVSLQNALKSSRILISSLPEIPRSIAVSSVVRWHEWGRVSGCVGPRFAAGQLLGWRERGGQYGSFYLPLEDLARIGTCEIREQWECDIQDVVGLSASKSELKEFSSLDDMVEANSRPMIEPVTAEKLDRNMAWPEIRILHRDQTSDHLACFRWDRRIFLMNSGGSHHFAAARYIASRIDRRVPIRGRLKVYGLDNGAVSSLTNDFEIFALPCDADSYLAFHDAMTACRATYLQRALPRPYGDFKAVFLPRSDVRSVRVARLLSESGFFDVGAHLQELSRRPVTSPGLDICCE